MVNVKVITLSYGIDEVFFECPHCTKEHNFYQLSPITCDNCGMPLPNVGNFLSNVSSIRIRSIAAFHKQKRNNPTLSERLDPIK
jgi:hypothetical protein